VAQGSLYLDKGLSLYEDTRPLSHASHLVPTRSTLPSQISSIPSFHWPTSSNQEQDTRICWGLGSVDPGTSGIMIYLAGIIYSSKCSVFFSSFLFPTRIVFSSALGLLPLILACAFCLSNLAVIEPIKCIYRGFCSRMWSPIMLYQLFFVPRFLCFHIL